MDLTGTQGPFERDDFPVWERRDVGSEWGPTSAGDRNYFLHVIEEGHFQWPNGTSIRDRVNLLGQAELRDLF